MRLSDLLRRFRELQESLSPHVDPLVTLVFSETGDVTNLGPPVLETCCTEEDSGLIVRIYSSEEGVTS